MIIDERSRHSMYSRLKELMGEEEATILMEHLPPVGWADVATKRDLDALRAELRADLADLRGGLYEAMNHQMNKVVAWMLTSMTLLTAATAGLTAAFA